MAYPSVYEWPERDFSFVCADQHIDHLLGVGQELILNGTGGSGPLYSSVSFGNVSRTISISVAGSSPEDLDGCVFKVTGIYNGASQTESITGPTVFQVTVEGSKYFNSVTSIVVTSIDTSGDLKVGTGTTGHTNWFAHNRNSSFPTLMVQVDVIDTTIEYSFETTIVDVYEAQYISDETSIPVLSGIIKTNPASVNSFQQVLIGSTVSDFGCYQYPSRYSRIFVSATNNTGSLVATFMQQAG